MKIDADKCTSCLECLDYCPVESIKEGDNSAYIDQEECVECGVCLKADVCPVEAIYLPEESLEYPRAIRMQFSDPSAEHPNLKAWGRGTEEAKTNDVTGKFVRGQYGLLMEFGRPGVGTRLSEIEKVTSVLCPLGVRIEPDNPVYNLLEDKDRGTIKREFVGEKILSAILELHVEEEQLAVLLKTIKPILETLDTVVSLGLVTRFHEDDALPVIPLLEESGFPVRPNAKINVGLGRPLIE